MLLPQESAPSFYLIGISFAYLHFTKMCRTELHFGKIQLLTPVERKLRLTNNSLVPAKFFVTLKVKRQGVFSVSAEQGVLQPTDTSSLTVSVCSNSLLFSHLKAILDEDVSTTAELAISIQDGKTILVAVSAIGVGTTVVCTAPCDKIDFTTIPTHQICSKELSLTNKGKHAEVIAWASDRDKKKKPEVNKKRKHTSVNVTRKNELRASASNQSRSQLNLAPTQHL